MPVGYDNSGNEDAVRDLIRCYSTDEVLKKINEEATKISQNNGGLVGAERVTYTVYKKKSRFPIKEKAIIQSWSLIDLAYYAILYSNDYRGKKIDKVDELYFLSVAVDHYKQRKESEFLQGLSASEPDFMFYLWGFAGEQIKLEFQKKAFDNLGRELYIIFESSKLCKTEYNFEQVVEQETGVTWKEIITFLLVGWFGFTQANTLEKVTNKIMFKDEECKEKFEKVISFYTTTYNEVKTTKIGRQILYAKPFVKTQRNEIVGLGPYLSLATYEHSIFWILRNHYQKNKHNPQEFVNFFGICFEKYLGKLLYDCLENSEYEKIPEESMPRADWKLEIGGYKILVEQKSSIMVAAVKQQETNVEAFKKYAIKTIIEALNQLFITEKELGNAKYIKIVLLYEDFIKSDILASIFELTECHLENDGYYWLVTIGEMEQLLELYYQNADEFKSIVEEKIQRETTFSKEGKGIEQLLEEHNIFKNYYLKRSEIAYYRDLAINEIKKYIKENGDV